MKISLFDNETETYDMKNQSHHVKFIADTVQEMVVKIANYAVDNNLSLRDTQQIIQSKTNIDIAWRIADENLKRAIAKRKLLTIQPTPIN